MARKRKRRGAASTEGDAPAPAPAPIPERLARPFAEALRGVTVGTPASGPRPPGGPAAERGRREPPPAPAGAPGAAKPPAAAPGPRHGFEDRVALRQAYLGVVRLGGSRKGGRRPAPAPAPAPPAEGPADAAARARLAALVAGGLRFRLDREPDGRLSALRLDADPGALEALRGGRATPEAALDLHGLRGDDAEVAVVRFVRASHREGARVLRLIPGKGLHSEAGLGVLRDRVVHALTEGGAAPYVLAFCSADPREGGAGALLVRLTGR